MAQARQFDLRRRVVQDAILPRHPAEPSAQRYQPRVLAAEAERLAVFLAAMEQVPLVAFQHGPGDLGGFAETAFGAPL